VADADRAGDILDRIRDQIKKAPPRKGRFDLNEAIDEVIVLARSAITKSESRSNPPCGRIGSRPWDRVQLQQVVLNLILNAIEAMNSVEVEAESVSYRRAKSDERVSWLCAIPGRALIRNTSSAFSRLSTPRSPAEWDGAVDLPIHHRCPWGTAVGRGE